MILKRYRDTAREGLKMVDDLAALACAEARQALQVRVRGLMFLALAALAALGAFAFAGIALLLLAWDTPYRLAAVCGLPLGLFALALLFARLAHRHPRPAFLTATRAELKETWQWMQARL